MQEIMQFMGHHYMLSMLWIFLFGAIILTTLQKYFSKIKEITHSEVIYLINKENAVIIDLRHRDEYYKGHIINSLNMTVANIKSGKLGILEKAKEKPVIIVCNNGLSSRDSALNLIKSGFQQVYVLKEGISSWNRDHLPLVQNK